MRALQGIIAAWCVQATSVGIATHAAWCTGPFVSENSWPDWGAHEAGAGWNVAYESTSAVSLHGGFGPGDPGFTHSPRTSPEREPAGLTRQLPSPLPYGRGLLILDDAVILPGEPPSPAESMRLYKVVDQWVREWNVPERVEAGSVKPAAAGSVSVGGVSVILRLDGEIVGRGAGLVDPSAKDSTGEVIRRAVAAALSEAERKAGVENDALRDEKTRSMAQRVQISLELAGELVPIDVQSYDQAELELAPGLDGVAVRIGDNTAASFPGNMLPTSTTIRLGLSRAASQAGGDPKMGLDEPKDLIGKHAATLYKFRVTHLAQTSRGASPIFLVRGARVIDQSEISARELREMADRIAEHLLTLAWPGNEAYGMTGLYDPAGDRSEVRFAPPVEQLTAVYVLRRYTQAGSLSPTRSLELRGFADRIVRDLKKIEPGETVPWDDTVAAAMWIAAAALEPATTAPPAGATRTTLPEECKRTVLTSFNALTGFSPNIPAGARGLVALALVELAAQEQPGGMKDEALRLAEAAVRRVYRDTPEGQLISTMPWLGFAELRLGQVRGDGPGDDIPAAVALRQMRETAWSHQVSPLSDVASEARGGLADVVGSITFGNIAGPGGASSGISWQTAQAVAFLPAMLADARLTPAADRPLEIARLLGAMRFIRQLQADATTEWMFASRTKSFGGIRAAPWDQRMPTDASSMSLLAVSEMVRVLERLSRK